MCFLLNQKHICSHQNFHTFLCQNRKITFLRYKTTNHIKLQKHILTKIANYRKSYQKCKTHIFCQTHKNAFFGQNRKNGLFRQNCKNALFVQTRKMHISVKIVKMLFSFKNAKTHFFVQNHKSPLFGQNRKTDFSVKPAKI